MRTILWAVSLCLSPSMVVASGLDDLMTALNQLSANTEVNAEYTSLYTRVEDENDEDEKKTISGELTFNVSEDQQGLHINYDPKTLTNMILESDLKTENAEAQSPTLTALQFIDTKDITTSLNGVNRLKRIIQQSAFINEQDIELNQRRLRQLSFQVPLKLLLNHAKTQKYVKSFESTLHIIIDENGVPIQSEIRYKGKGRAYLVLSMKVEGSMLTEYQLMADRLLQRYHLEISRYDSTFGAGSVKKQLQLTVLPKLAHLN